MTQHALAPVAVPVLARFCASRLLVAFDFDGVLAPIVRRRHQARVPARLHGLLVEVALRYPVVVVSGRRLADVAPRLAGIPLRCIVGNFGYEWSDALPPSPHPLVAPWVAALRKWLAPHPGILVEDKRHTIAVHYREAAEPRLARHATLRAARRLAGARLLPGTLAVTILPPEGPDKGAALQRARRDQGCARALYVGDDGTDEPAFASAPASRLFSVRVAPVGASEARFRLDHQREVHALLQVLRDLRPLAG